MSGTDLQLRPEERAVHGLELAERVFTAPRREAIARFLNVTPDEPALVPYLASCASYGLDPVMGQIWLIPQRVKIRDGEADRFETRYRPATGRDGYLAVARRDARYRGIRGTTVCEHDSFEVVYEGDWEHDPKILHRLASKPTQFDADVNPARWRGRILGAWAVAHAEGLPPFYYFAPIHEHIRMREKWEGSGRNRHRVVDSNGRPVLEPDGAWGYVSTMIQKAAQSYVLRIQFGITGLVPVDEMPDGGRVIDGHAEPVEDQGFDWEEFAGGVEDGELVGRLMRAVDEVNDLAPLTWPSAKLEMVLTGRSADELAAVADQIEGEARILRSQRDARAAAARSEADVGGGASAVDAPVEDVTDAQIVPEGEESPESDPQATERGERVAALRRRASQLEEMLEGSIGEDERTDLNAELDQVEAELAAVESGEQESLL